MTSLAAWRRRYSKSVEQLGEEPLLAAAATAFGTQRGRAVHPIA